MRITHISNSFMLIESEEDCLCCDPWVGVGNHGGWHSFPEFDRDRLVDLVQRTDAVYISHLHSDHFDPDFLVASGLIDREFFIKRYQNSTLAARLRRLGALRVQEVDPYFPVYWRDMELTIIPQRSSTTANLQDDVNYDLDTSLIVHHAGITFFNQVDNPLTQSLAEEISAFVVSRYGKLDVAAFVAGAAGEYPQCFLNIDREQEARRIVRSSLISLGARLKVLQPDIIFPAGGTYFIPGKFSDLNRFIAQPTADEIHGYVEENHWPAVRSVSLEGGGTLHIYRTENGIEFRISTALKPYIDSVAASIEKHRDDLYMHEKSVSVTDDELDEAFESARANWLSYLAMTGVTVHSRFSFQLYQNLEINESGGIAAESELQYELSVPDGNADVDLTVHIDRNAFFRCLTKQASWNQTLSGSLCLFTREPNVHYPSDLFGLNRLTT